MNGEEASALRKVQGRTKNMTKVMVKHDSSGMFSSRLPSSMKDDLEDWNS